MSIVIAPRVAPTASCVESDDQARRGATLIDDGSRHAGAARARPDRFWRSAGSRLRAEARIEAAGLFQMGLGGLGLA
jgi:hypothetical protein